MLNILFHSKEKEQLNIFIKILKEFGINDNFSITYCNNYEIFSKLSSENLIYNYMIDLSYNFIKLDKSNINVICTLNLSDSYDKKSILTSKLYNLPNNNAEINEILKISSYDVINQSLTFFEPNIKNKILDKKLNF